MYFPNLKLPETKYNTGLGFFFKTCCTTGSISMNMKDGMALTLQQRLTTIIMAMINTYFKTETSKYQNPHIYWTFFSLTESCSIVFLYKIVNLKGKKE